MEDELDLREYIQTIIKQKVIILSVMLIGAVMVISFPLKAPFHKVTGYYIVDTPNPVQFVSVEQIKNPFLTIENRKNTAIIILSMTGLNPQETKDELIDLASKMPLKSIKDVSSEIIKPMNTKVFAMILVIFFGIFVGFVKEWVTKEKI